MKPKPVPFRDLTPELTVLAGCRDTLPGSGRLS